MGCRIITDRISFRKGRPADKKEADVRMRVAAAPTEKTAKKMDG
jgi:hypothetical protein